MDHIKFIKSLEELLYEVATWLLFYPRIRGWHSLGDRHCRDTPQPN